MNKKFILALILSSVLVVINLSARSNDPQTPKERKKISAASPVADFTVSDSIICVGTSVTFTDLSSNNPTSWNWTFAGGIPATSTLQNPIVLYSTAGAYAVTLTATNGSGNNTLIKNNYIIVNSLPTVTITGSSASICQGNSDTLKANGATSYLWNTSATTSSIVVSPSTTTVYSVVGTNLNCNADTTFTVTVFPSPTITISGNNTICFDSSTTLTASGALNYVWAPSSGLSCTACPSPVANPTVTTIYTIIGTNNNGCSNAVTDTVNIIPAPAVTASISNRQPCEGVPVTLSAVGSPPGGTYLWKPGNKTGPIVIDTPLTATVYTVEYTTECGTATDTVSVEVAPIPSLFFSANPRRGCVQFCTQFTASYTPPSLTITSWNWTFGDGGTSTLKNPSYCYDIPGEYAVTLEAQTSQGCTSTLPTSSGFITVHPLPQAAFTYSPDPATIIDPLISFTDNTKGSQIIDWYWNFGDNADSISSLQNPTHLYQDTGRYCVKMGVMDIYGCVDTAINCIEIGTQFTFYIPSAFSPNNDGINDYFTPRGTDVGTYEMYIFDRWGMKIFYTNNIWEGWNGGVNNKGSRICQEDVYVYLINVTDTKGVQHHYTGSVTLLK